VLISEQETWHAMLYIPGKIWIETGRTMEAMLVRRPN